MSCIEKIKQKGSNAISTCTTQEQQKLLRELAKFNLVTELGEVPLGMACDFINEPGSQVRQESRDNETPNLIARLALFNSPATRGLVNIQDLKSGLEVQKLLSKECVRLLAQWQYKVDHTGTTSTFMAESPGEIENGFKSQNCRIQSNQLENKLWEDAMTFLRGTCKSSNDFGDEL